jgi:hypothetical protein
VSPIEEDSRDLASIHVRIPIFQALARGFLEEMASVLTPTEIANLPFSGKLLTFEVGIRFLTDHLLGYPMKALSDRFSILSTLIQKADSLLFHLFPKLLRYGANANVIFTK